LKARIIVTLILVLTLFSCGHVNNLKYYDLAQKEIFFERIATGGAGEVDIALDHPSYTGSKDLDIIKDITLAVGNALLTAETEKKLMNAASPDTMVIEISAGIQNTLIKFLRINPVYELTENSEFIVTTTLNNFKIISSAFGINISVDALVQIFDRNGGNLVWEYDNKETVSLRNDFNVLRYTSPGAGKIIQISELSNLSEEQIRFALKEAAFQVGKNIGEVLRKDISKSKKK
jgi:hypothetical protein